MGIEGTRPAGITAISTLLVTLGAIVCGAALLAICMSMDTLTTVAGLRFEGFMLGFFFAGGTLAGFGVGLYEGHGWARTASLAALAFVATLQVFAVSATGLQHAISYEAGLFALAASSIVYLSMPTAKKFFSPFRQSAAVNVDVQQRAPAMQQAS